MQKLNLILLAALVACSEPETPTSGTISLDEYVEAGGDMTYGTTDSAWLSEYESWRHLTFINSDGSEYVEFATIVPINADFTYHDAVWTIHLDRMTSASMLVLYTDDNTSIGIRGGERIWH